MKRADGSVTQAMKDLGDAVNDDCKKIEEAFQKYGSLYFGENNEYKLANDLKESHIKKIKKSLQNDLKKWKDEKVFVVYIFACHGI